MQRGEPVNPREQNHPVSKKPDHQRPKYKKRGRLSQRASKVKGGGTRRPKGVSGRAKRPNWQGSWCKKENTHLSTETRKQRGTCTSDRPNAKKKGRKGKVEERPTSGLHEKRAGGRLLPT